MDAVLNYETKSKYYDTQRNILKCETKRNEIYYNEKRNEMNTTDIQFLLTPDNIFVAPLIRMESYPMPIGEFQSQRIVTVAISY
jgi:hypothetical protein